LDWIHEPILAEKTRFDLKYVRISNTVFLFLKNDCFFTFFFIKSCHKSFQKEWIHPNYYRFIFFGFNPKPLTKAQG